jgi:hypothetical protein
MATKTPTVENAVGGDNATMRVTWANMANGDDGAPVAFAQCADRSVQVVGTFGAGGNVKWEGSNDEVNYATLTDPQGNALDITAAKIEQVSELTAIARPRVSAGDGTTSLTVIALLRRAQPMRT